jgi:hypothetical protein
LIFKTLRAGLLLPTLLLRKAYLLPCQVELRHAYADCDDEAGHGYEVHTNTVPAADLWGKTARTSGVN